MGNPLMKNAIRQFSIWFVGTLMVRLSGYASFFINLLRHGVFLGFLMAILVSPFSPNANNVPSYLGMFVFLSTLYLAFTIIHATLVFIGVVGNKVLAINSTNSLLKDTRRPVVYLRSFKDDESYDVFSKKKIFQEILLPSHPLLSGGLDTLTTTEQKIDRVLNSLGPCVCIGDPREYLPDLGVVRVYHRKKDNSWQDAVLKFLLSSKIVIVRAGNTKNLQWEIDRCIEILDPTRLLILNLRKGKSDVTVFEEMLLSRLYALKIEPALIEGLKTKLNHLNRLREWHLGYIISFKPDWQPEMTTLDRPPRWHRYDEIWYQSELSRTINIALTNSGIQVQNISPSFHSGLKANFSVYSVFIFLLLIALLMLFSVLFPEHK